MELIRSFLLKQLLQSSKNQKNLGAQCFDLDMVITWSKMTKNKRRCEAEMRYKWTKMNLDAQCFEFEMVTKWPNMNCGAKLRCTKNEQK
mgnify:CR=1 FL=1